MFHELLDNVTIPLTAPKTAEDLDVAISCISDKIMEAFNKACPLQQKRHKTTNTFTAEMIELVKQKRRLRRQKAKSRRRDDFLMVQFFQQEINRKNHELKKLQVIQRKQEIRSMCINLNAEKNNARFFNLFDKIRGKEPHEKVYCDISDANKTASTDKEKANLFATRLERLHQTASDSAFDEDWKTTIESHIVTNEDAFLINPLNEYSESEHGDDNPLLRLITLDEIHEQLKNCKNKSAPGEDGLTYFLLKKLPNNIIKYLQYIFNLSLKLGYFPKDWKTATIKMTPKCGKDNKEAKNWRPISLISVLAKLFERIIATRLSTFLEKNNLLSSSQSGFRKGRMTSEQLFRLAEDSMGSMKTKGITAALFLDAEAAFDQAWHDAIRYKLHKLNLPQRLVRLLSSFLTDRKLKVKVGNEYSKEVKMKAGTPQGSCLSPLLYIILVNDIPEVGPSASKGQFADDIALWANAYTFNAAISRLQKAVNSLEGWCRRWRIKLNGAKSNLLIIHRLHKKPEEDLCIQLFNDIIRPCKSARYLGVQFDSNLNFKEHFANIQSKATSRLNLFKLLVKNGVENRILIKLYKMYVRPLLEYGSLSFLTAKISQLQQIQNEFLRTSMRLPSYLRTDLLHQSAGLETIKDRLTSLNTNLMKKMLAHVDIQKTVEKSLSATPLNLYKSPLDVLIVSLRSHQLIN